MALTDNLGHPKGLVGRLMLVIMDKEHFPMARWALEQLKFPQSGDIADIGCGGGYNMKRMLERSGSAKVYGIDISAESVRKSKKVNKSELGKRCEVFQGSAEKLPFKDGQLDLVTAFETVYFWKNIGDCFKEVARTLKNGGKFAVICNYGDPKIDWEKKVPCMTRYTEKQLAELMKGAGLKDIVIRLHETLYLVQGTK